MTYESYINYAIYDGTGKRVFNRQEICAINRIEIISAFPWVHVIFQLPAGLITTVTGSRIVGEDGTYVKYKGNKYETMEDYYKLQQVVEREKIQNILNSMNEG